MSPISHAYPQLESRGDWEPWYFALRATSPACIWPAIDPMETVKPPLLHKPTKPRFGQFSKFDTATRLRDLSADERQEFQLELRVYELDYNEWLEQEHGLQKVQDFIIRTVPQIYWAKWGLLGDIPATLFFISTQFIPSMAEKCAKLMRTWIDLASPGSRTIFSWAAQLKHTYVLMKGMGMSEVMGTSPHHYFLQAVQAFCPDFSAHPAAQIFRLSADGANQLVDFEILVDEFVFYFDTFDIPSRFLSTDLKSDPSVGKPPANIKSPSAVSVLLNPQSKPFVPAVALNVAAPAFSPTGPGLTDDARSVAVTEPEPRRPQSSRLVGSKFLSGPEKNQSPSANGVNPRSSDDFRNVNVKSNAIESNGFVPDNGDDCMESQTNSSARYAQSVSNNSVVSRVAASLPVRPGRPSTVAPTSFAKPPPRGPRMDRAPSQENFAPLDNDLNAGGAFVPDTEEDWKPDHEVSADSNGVDGAKWEKDSNSTARAGSSNKPSKDDGLNTGEGFNKENDDKGDTGKDSSQPSLQESQTDATFTDSGMGYDSFNHNDSNNFDSPGGFVPDTGEGDYDPWTLPQTQDYPAPPPSTLAPLPRSKKSMSTRDGSINGDPPRSSRRGPMSVASSRWDDDDDNGVNNNTSTGNQFSSDGDKRKGGFAYTNGGRTSSSFTSSRSSHTPAGPRVKKTEKELQAEMSPCPCGIRHRYQECIYFNDYLPAPTKAFQLRPATLDRIHRQLKNNVRLARAIDSALAMWRDKRIKDRRPLPPRNGLPVVNVSAAVKGMDRPYSVLASLGPKRAATPVQDDIFKPDGEVLW